MGPRVWGAIAVAVVVIGGATAALTLGGSASSRPRPAPARTATGPVPGSTTTASAPDPSTTTAPGAATRTRQWVALGDSYSAGTGEARAGGCATSDAAYAVQLASSLGAGASLTAAACSGATTADVLARQLPQVRPDTDLVTITVGGDDLGFAAIAEQCILGGCPSWFLTGDPPVALPGEPAGIAPSTGDPSGTAWQVLQHRLVQVYTRIRTAMAPGGDLYVLSYPLAFADPDTWPPLAQLTGCSFFSPAAAVAANRFAITLGDTIRVAVDAANQVLAKGKHPIGGHVHFVDWRNEQDVVVRALGGRSVPTGPNGLCPPAGQPAWLNSVTTQPVSVNALHPTTCGYWAAAARLAAAMSVAPPPSQCGVAAGAPTTITG